MNRESSSDSTNTLANRTRLVTQKPVVNHSSPSALAANLTSQSRVTWLNHYRWRSTRRGVDCGPLLRGRRKRKKWKRRIVLWRSSDVDNLGVGTSKHTPAVLTGLAVFGFNAGIVALGTVVSARVVQQRVTRSWTSLRPSRAHAVLSRWWLWMLSVWRLWGVPFLRM